MMTFHPYGDSALLVNFEQKIDKATHASVTALATAVQSAIPKGIVFCTPAYCSLTIGYDAGVWHYGILCEKIKTLAGQAAVSLTKQGHRVLNIPVCYEEGFGLDWEEVERLTGHPKQDVIQLHSSTEFLAYMLGFLPGFVYLGSMPEALAISRKTTPRLRVPAGSVGLAGVQTGIYPSEAPGGWQIIGRTPLKIFDAGKEQPFLFQPGDAVKFHQVSSEDFHRMEAEMAGGHFKTTSIHG